MKRKIVLMFMAFLICFSIVGYGNPVEKTTKNHKKTSNMIKVLVIKEVKEFIMKARVKNQSIV